MLGRFQTHVFLVGLVCKLQEAYAFLNKKISNQ